MKLLIIVLCLLSERYLIHKISYSRFSWFAHYCKRCLSYGTNSMLFNKSIMQLLLVILPLIIFVSMLLYLCHTIVFGLLFFLLQLLLVYYCIGPVNPFYPLSGALADDEYNADEIDAVNYFVAVNQQLIAVIFWYITVGPIFMLLYRLCSLCQYSLVQEFGTENILAKNITAILNWIPVRITAMLYLLVGNFQRGLQYFMQMFFRTYKQNNQFLSNIGLLAARVDDNAVVSLTVAQHLIEQSVIVYVILLAFFTIIACV